MAHQITIWVEDDTRGSDDQFTFLTQIAGEVMARHPQERIAYLVEEVAPEEDEFPFIGWLDSEGNILDTDDAQAVIDALGDGTKITDLYTKVETEDFWQADLDDEDPGEQPRYRIVSGS